MGSLRSFCGRCGLLDRVQVGRAPVRIVGFENFEQKTLVSLTNRGEPWTLIRKKNTGIQSPKKPFSADACGCCLAVPRAAVSAGVTSAVVCRVPESVDVQPR